MSVASTRVPSRSSSPCAAGAALIALKKGFAQVVGLQQKAELQQRGGVGHAPRFEFDAGEAL